MAFEIGVLFAVVALVFWGFGDFLIQRSTRKLGDWETLFVISFIGSIILLPFMYHDLGLIFSSDKIFSMLILVSGVFLIASLFIFEALKTGKISIVEPIMTIEVPVTAILAFVLVKENLPLLQVLVITFLFLGLVLVSLKKTKISSKVLLEKGVMMAVIGSVLMGSSNFLVGVSSRVTNPLLTVWFFSVFMTFLSVFYLNSNNRFGKMVKDFKTNRADILRLGIIDNLAWVAFGSAVLFIPIAVATALSESYMTLAAIMGVLINKEILMRHQKVGLVISIFSAIALAAFYI